MASDLQPLKLYACGPAPNPWKVVHVLEELGLPYETIQIEYAKVKQEPLISLNPNGRVPALVDPNKDITLWESGAIIDYLIDVYDTEAKLHYTSIPEKYTTKCWEHFQTTGQGPYFGQKAWFSKFHPEKIQSAIDRYSNEILRVMGVLDGHLAKQESGFLVGDRITYADLMFIPYFQALPKMTAPELDTSKFTHVHEWLARMRQRPATAKVVQQHDDAMAPFLPK